MKFKIAAFIAILGLMGYIVYDLFNPNTKILTRTVTKSIVRVDTITVKDPVPVKVTKVLRLYRTRDSIVYTLSKPDTVHDSIYYPVEQKEYMTEEYHAWVSGYEAQLDSIKTYPKTITIMKNAKPHKWGVSAFTGVGLGVNGISPVIGIGISRTLFNF